MLFLVCYCRCSFTVRNILAQIYKYSGGPWNCSKISFYSWNCCQNLHGEQSKQSCSLFHSDFSIQKTFCRRKSQEPSHVQADRFLPLKLLNVFRLNLQLCFIMKIWFESLVILGRRRRRWEDNIKMDIKEVGCGGMDWIKLLKLFRLNLQLGFIIKIWFESLVIQGRSRRRWEDNIKMDLKEVGCGCMD